VSPRIVYLGPLPPLPGGIAPLPQLSAAATRTTTTWEDVAALVVKLGQ
jgi:hypothetical protein